MLLRLLLRTLLTFGLLLLVLLVVALTTEWPPEHDLADARAADRAERDLLFHLSP